jgi:hypothetical protein
VPRSQAAPRLFLLDSPWEDRSTTQPHRGRLGSDQLDSLKRLLDEAGPEFAHVVLLHHHVLPHGRATEDPDYSLLQDAGVLEEAPVRLRCHHRPPLRGGRYQ